MAVSMAGGAEACYVARAGCASQAPMGRRESGLVEVGGSSRSPMAT